MMALSFDIKYIKPCELKRALDSIYLENTTFPCKYNSIKETVHTIYIAAAIQILWIFIVLFLIQRALVKSDLMSRRKNLF